MYAGDGNGNEKYRGARKAPAPAKGERLTRTRARWDHGENSRFSFGDGIKRSCSKRFASFLSRLYVFAVLCALKTSFLSSFPSSLALCREPAILRLESAPQFAPSIRPGESLLRGEEAVQDHAMREREKPLSAKFGRTPRISPCFSPPFREPYRGYVFSVMCSRRQSPPCNGTLIRVPCNDPRACTQPVERKRRKDTRSARHAKSSIDIP